MKEPEKEEEEEEEEEEYGDVEELMTEFRKLKKAYEVEDSKKFSSAVGKKMDALRKPAQDILEGYNLLQDQLREGYFLDQNEYKIYFKIDDKDGLRFYSFERPDGKKIAFKNMRRGDDWNSATTDMTKEEWVFYRQSSLFKFDPSAYRNEPWKLFNDIIQFMSFFRSPANPQKLWEKYDDKATKKIGEAFKEWYEKDVMGSE